LRIRSLVPVKTALSRAQRIVAYLTPQEVALLAEAIATNRKPKGTPAPFRALIAGYGDALSFHFNPRGLPADPAAGRI